MIVKETPGIVLDPKPLLRIYQVFPFPLVKERTTFLFK